MTTTITEESLSTCRAHDKELADSWFAKGDEFNNLARLGNNKGKPANPAVGLRGFKV
ncbi:hypothetical protein [Pseudorhodobacter antarcticus]|jgi:hypothetical protein|uniref:hypothetical protein n=1 Tax=Pseudorhodobacter antarcticus TaxID=1077947 RepID=UPI000ADF2F6A|nr:hypothetical protein [Pseudorhodobacter antarcticus]